jgi:hypothetical protein
VRDLPDRQQIAFAALLVGLAMLPILSAAIVLHQGWRPAGDNALIGMRVHDVLDGKFPLIGQPSTGENMGTGVESSHPGPIEFYLVAPFVLVLGPIVGLAIGAAAINSAALVGIAWLAFRRGGTGLLVVASLAAVLLCGSLGGNFLHDPVSSNIGAIASLTLLFATWSVIAGDLRTFPVFIVVASYVMQDHLTYLGTGVITVVLGLGFTIWWARRIARRAADSSWLKPSIIGGLVVGGVLWLPVALDQLFGTHNLTSIFRTFTGKSDPGHGVAFGSGRLAEANAPVPIFARSVGRLGYLHTPATHELIGGYLVLAAILALTVVFVLRRRSELSAMGFVALVAAAAGAYSAMKLPESAGVKEANLRWMWTVSAFAWVTLAWLVWEVLPKLWREIIGLPAAAISVVALFIASIGVINGIGLDTDRDGTILEPTSQMIERIERDLPKGTYRVQYAGGPVGLSVGPALFHDLELRGDDVYLDIGGGFGRAYGDDRRFDGQRVDGTIFITAEADGSYPEGTRLLARQKFYVNPGDAAPTTIRVYVTDQEG